MDASLHKVQVGDRLRVAIQALGISQAEFARSLSVEPNKLGNWLRGDNYPPNLVIVAMSERWTITADWLLRGVVSGMASPLADALWKSVSASSAVQAEGDRQESVAVGRGGSRKKALVPPVL